MGDQLKTRQDGFSESQIFNNKFFIYALILVQLILLYSAIAMFQENNEVTIVYWILILLPLGFIILGLLTKLETHIDQDGISYRWNPFQKSFRSISWDMIVDAEVITYGFVGYGLRFSLKYGTVHNVKGNKGLLIEMKGGKRKLIGTQKAEKMKEFLKTFESK